MIQAGTATLIDVRSEGEFAQGAVPCSANAPILNDDERHQVGLTYKQEGQAAAVALGHQLVDPVIASRVATWLRLAAPSPQETLVTCWRGGMRSLLACEQMLLAGKTTRRVAGGYKAMRRVLMAVLAEPPPLLVVGGLTGSGKTSLINSLPLAEKVDLEHLALHRGSSFGGRLHQSQPAQASFENAVAMGVRQARRPVVIEDESSAIGSLRLPDAFYQGMQKAPVVWVEASLEERTRSIFAEYLESPLALGHSVEVVSDVLATGIGRLSRRLGGELTRTLSTGVTSALASGKTDLATHAPWIETLLTGYYDKSYHYAFTRAKRQVLFKGSFEECRQWILNRYA